MANSTDHTDLFDLSLAAIASALADAARALAMARDEARPAFVRAPLAARDRLRDLLDLIVSALIDADEARGLAADLAVDA